MRGGASPTLRRIKLGGRDVLKLDIAQARLHEAGSLQSERLDTPADEVAAISADARSLPPRTLMFVFGDHGFQRMEAREKDTTAGGSGGGEPRRGVGPRRCVAGRRRALTTDWPKETTLCPNGEEKRRRRVRDGPAAARARWYIARHGARSRRSAGRAGARRHGTTHLFTLCGGHIQAIYDGCLDEGIRVVDVRHEQTAGHAADGYARVTGRPGVCAVTAGPGVTDVVTAVANAQRAGIPMIIIGGAGPTRARRHGLAAGHGPRRADAADHEVERAASRRRDRIAEYIDAAFRVAQAERARAGVPRDAARSADELGTTTPTCPATRPLGDAAAPGRRSARSSRAPPSSSRARERPCSSSASQLRWSPERDALRARRRRVGRAVLPQRHGARRAPARAPAPHDAARARFALAQTDVVLRLRHAVRLPPRLRPRRLEPGREDRADRSRRRASSAATAASTSPSTATAASSSSSSSRELGATKKRDSRAGSRRCAPTRTSRRAKMAAEIDSERLAAEPAARLRRARQAPRQPNDIVIGDGGDFVATAAYVLKMQWPQLWMDPGPLGTLGVGPGYAMAAKLARPDAQRGARLRRRRVRPPRHRVRGDGAPEHPGRSRVIGNDAGWTQIRRGQVELYGDRARRRDALEYTRYEKVVEACGGFGVWVETHRGARPRARRGVRVASKPACVNVKIAKSDFRKGAISV